MLYLSLAIAAFFGGVLVHPVLHGKTKALAMLDAAIVVCVVVLVAFFMLPHTLEESGAIGTLGIAAGFLLTSGLDRLSRVSASSARPWGVSFLVGALLVHALFDGAALALPMHHEGEASMGVIAGVLIHRFPLGMAVHHLLGPTLRMPLIAAFMLSLSTAFGYFYADETFNESAELVIHLLECFVVGMLIQVVISHLPSLKVFTHYKD